MSEDINGIGLQPYMDAAQVLLSSERARGKIKDVILYKGCRGNPTLAVVHTEPMHENFFLEGDETTYDCRGFARAIIEGEAAQLKGCVDIGLTVSELVEDKDLPHEIGSAIAANNDDMFRAFVGGKVFNPETGKFDTPAVKIYPVATAGMLETLRSGWDFYD